MLKNWRIELEFSKEELLDLAKKIYEESCNGYLDLKDSYCFKIIDEIYEKKEKEKEKLSLNKNDNFYNGIVASSSYLRAMSAMTSTSTSISTTTSY